MTRPGPFLVVDCWGEPAHAYAGDYVHYKMGTEKIGKIKIEIL